VLVISGIAWGIGVGGAFTVALQAITPGTEQGASMGIMTTFRGIGGLVAPVAGGFFLNEALQHTVTYGQAFTDMYLAATAAVAIAFLLTAYFVIRTRKTAIPATAPAVQG
jgi:fucose permease